ncbi:hypothetical protein DAPPUDRAFT_118646 [Daphnia pulex]|uniref:Strawberry notch AAA domain-containing protein n=1 Tax=Daphnia pulex TaxID=6669 RepID=E9HWA1_DAPPU|nr:hypothetical protein DAPPUDRAFT_118646 [Daphnia pulex]|eukprot:EFX63979.1 hypothetical protein DAPPUDRAFT_118646 [Daphnia pulex]
MSMHCFAFEGKKHTPASQLLDILTILYRQGDWLAFVMHAPVEYTATVQNLKETIQPAFQQHETTLLNSSRAGFFIGDSTGVGKGRMNAGIIFENRKKGKLPFVSVSINGSNGSIHLKYAAQQDLKDIEADKIKVHSLTGMIYGHRISAESRKVSFIHALLPDRRVKINRRTSNTDESTPSMV